MLRNANQPMKLMEHSGTNGSDPYSIKYWITDGPDAQSAESSHGTFPWSKTTKVLIVQPLLSLDYMIAESGAQDHAPILTMFSCLSHQLSFTVDGKHTWFPVLTARDWRYKKAPKPWILQLHVESCRDSA